MSLKIIGTAVLTMCVGMASTVSAQMSFGPQVESPVVNEDRTVTFNLRAPNAQDVQLSGQFLEGNQAMTKSDAGVWSVTVGPVEPNLYPYCFVVDGLQVADPLNQDIFPNEGFKNSLVDIPGDEPAMYAVKDVPHGSMSYHYYESKTLGETRPLVVYTPPGYDKNNDNYPVFYLVSGTTDTEETWFKVGKLNFILDNLIAEKRAVPMIVVMPYGNMGSTPMPSSPQAADFYKIFNDELTENIMPYVEANYHTKNDRESRAIAGFSRGGGQSLFAGFTHIDKFSWICSYSAYLIEETMNEYFSDLVKNPAKTNDQLNLLWMGVGKSDFLYRDTAAFDTMLTDMKFDHKVLYTEGGHTWMNARHYLHETLQMFFK